MNFRGDKNAEPRLLTRYHKICRFQTPGRQAGQYLLFQAVVPDRPGNDRAGSLLSKCQLSWAKSSMGNSPVKVKAPMPTPLIKNNMPMGLILN